MQRFASLLLALAVAACDDGAAGDDDDTAASADAAPQADAAASPTCALSPAIDDLVDAERARQGISAVAAGIDMPGCDFTAASGLADRPAAREAVPEDRFRVGSITKTFTAAVVLQLVDEGKLALDDPLSDYVTFPGGDGITISQLLSHTSGIYNYTDSMAIWSQSTEAWTRQEVLDVAAAQASLFTPGTQWAYSNTNYFLLGLVVESVTGNQLHAELRARLLEPLGLDDTFLEGEEAIPGGFVRGYYRDPGSGDFLDITDEIHPSLAWAAGSIVSNVDDLHAWAEALFAGDVLDPATRTLMLTPVTLAGGAVAPTGLCVFVSDQGPLGVLYSHGGSIHGFQALFGYLPAKQAAMAALTNDMEGDPNTVLIEVLEAVDLL